MTRWLVASAWPYINYVPHLGTIIGSVLSADVMARHLRMKDEEVLFVSGSDEHGTPIEVEAIREGIPPKKLTDRNHAKVTELFRRWGISFDNYTRTENETHKRVVCDICLKLFNNGYVFTEETVLLYCPNERRFLPDRFVEGSCPHCQSPQARGDQCDSCGRLLEPTKLENPKCVICGSTPVVKKTKHWYLDLARFNDQLKDYVMKNAQFPDNARNFTSALLDEGLKPRSLTRDNEWGIPAPFPDSTGKTIYVWMEAVLGYLSASIEYFANNKDVEGWKKFWKDPTARSLYFIGKDNIPFHTIILPALLLGTGESYVLPWNVNSTEFLLFESQKFSKSRRVGVWIDEALDMFPADYWRYVLLSIRPETKDTNFTWETFQEKVNSDLNDTIGNFVHRTLTFLERYFGGSVPQPGNLDQTDLDTLQSIQKYTELITSDLDGFRIQASANRVTEFCREGNKYINDRAPWKAVQRAPWEAARTLFVAVQFVKAVSIFLHPFMPFTSYRLRRLLNLDVDEKITWKQPSAELPPGHKLQKPTTLFRKIDVSEINKQTSGEVEKSTVSRGEFERLVIKVGRIINAENISTSDKLFKLTIDIGGEQKIAVAGLKPNYTAEELRDKLVGVVTNITPQKIFGITSEIMILAAEEGSSVSLLEP
ncbi:MAG: methionine--tRNA ligase, partial [Candidatus Bathyarchaeia archaeon]